MRTGLRVQVYDAGRNAFRAFAAELGYQARCGRDLHQFQPPSLVCACRRFRADGLELRAPLWRYRDQRIGGAGA